MNLTPKKVYGALKKDIDGITSGLSNCVTLDTAQTITGDKTFTPDGGEIEANVFSEVEIKKAYNESTSQIEGGNLTVAGIITVNGSDYAERFEPMGECPECRFVTLDGERVRLAQPDDYYILGVVSQQPSVIGDKDCDGIAVGLLGKLVVEDDGTGLVNGYVVCGKNGKATKYKYTEHDEQCAKYRVMSRVDSTHIRILVRG